MRKNKKKKGFTLIELVIVLAVLAIIALIAIPNFNKVRTDSQKKADKQTCEVIERVTLMAIADQDMIVTGDVQIPIAAPVKKGENAVIGNPTNVLSSGNLLTQTTPPLKLEWKQDTSEEPKEVGKTNYARALKDISKPQEKGKNSYLVTIDANENVTVTTEAVEIK